MKNLVKQEMFFPLANLEAYFNFFTLHLTNLCKAPKTNAVGRLGSGTHK